MDNTSKIYYEAVMRDYKAYARGRSLEQYCRDEAVDYHWLSKVQKEYGTSDDKPQVKKTRKVKTEPADLIRLHFEDDGQDSPVMPDTTSEGKTKIAEGKAPEPWKVESLKVISPSGEGIEIRTSNLSAVAELLAKLTA